jgi:hypothetical protein
LYRFQEFISPPTKKIKNKEQNATTLTKGEKKTHLNERSAGDDTFCLGGNGGKRLNIVVRGKATFDIKDSCNLFVDGNEIQTLIVIRISFNSRHTKHGNKLTCMASIVATSSSKLLIKSAKNSFLATFTNDNDDDDEAKGCGDVTNGCANVLETGTDAGAGVDVGDGTTETEETGVKIGVETGGVGREGEIGCNGVAAGRDGEGEKDNAGTVEGAGTGDIGIGRSGECGDECVGKATRSELALEVVVVVCGIGELNESSSGAVLATEEVPAVKTRVADAAREWTVREDSGVRIFAPFSLLPGAGLADFPIAGGGEMMTSISGNCLICCGKGKKLEEEDVLLNVDVGDAVGFDCI